MFPWQLQQLEPNMNRLRSLPRMQGNRAMRMIQRLLMRPLQH
jgi:hypothetical protein